MNIGTAEPKQSGIGVLARARERAALIPDLLVEAHKIASTVTSGWHGRRRRGNGDTFWQFRPYDPDEGMSRIDWRRSAREDSVYVRDQEWEAAHTIWVWADNSPSMLYKSETAGVSKQSRAVVLALAATEILAKSGERVGWPGLTGAIAHRNAAERVAATLMTSKTQDDLSFPPLDQMRSRSDLVVISDFLEPVDRTLDYINAAASKGLDGSLIHIIDPAEERFPFSGRTEFQDPESGARLTYGRAENIGAGYIDLFRARRHTLSEHCRKIGWNHIVHHTDRPASTALITLHTLLSGEMRS